MPKKSLLVVILVVLLAACFLIRCETDLPEGSTPGADASYKATFLLNGEIYAEQTVSSGDAPKAVTVALPGLHFQGWVDEAGNAVAPENHILTKDVTYTAVYTPELALHAPFLMTDDSGMLRPSDPLTADELSQALIALAEEAAHAYFPALPAGSEAISTEDLKAALSHFFLASNVEQAFSACGDTASRAEFAVALCRLLDRTGSETVTVSDNAVYPVDVNVNTENYTLLLEASVAHTQSESGTAWADIDLPTDLEPGFNLIGGWLYYVQEDGHFLRDSKVGALRFESDGRYTCGDAELDRTVADILNTLSKENPDATRFEMLRLAYNYVRDSFTYLRRDPYNMGDTGWEIKDAKIMFESSRGNCYNFAAAFWSLARGLGYEARAVSGTCLQDKQPHAWVIMTFDGEDYFFDPQWENNYHTRDIYDKDMFMITMEAQTWWNYRWVE